MVQGVKKMIYLAVVGSREYPDTQEVIDSLNRFKKQFKEMSIITGGAEGVDRTAERWAFNNNIPCEVIRPIDPTDKFSYLLRNVEIITKANLIVAFWDLESKGTKFVIDYCEKRGFNILIKTPQKAQP
jgi:hypothetical protein